MSYNYGKELTKWKKWKEQEEQLLRTLNVEEDNYHSYINMIGK